MFEGKMPFSYAVRLKKNKHSSGLMFFKSNKSDELIAIYA